MVKRPTDRSKKKITLTRKSLNQEQGRRLALALPETREASHQGRRDLRVRGKIFATLPPDAQTIVLKTTPADLGALVWSDSQTFRDAWGGRWVRVDLRRVDPDFFHKLLVDAWRLAAPKTLIRAYRAGDLGKGV